MFNRLIRLPNMKLQRMLDYHGINFTVFDHDDKRMACHSLAKLAADGIPLKDKNGFYLVD